MSVTRSGVELLGPMKPEYDEILTDEALALVATLARKHTKTVKELLAAREKRQAQIDAGALPDFLPETKDVREGDWQVRQVPDDLLDRRVEITGPVERKMIINALNTPVKCYMADFEDSLSPTWENAVEGQIHLRDAIQRKIDFTADNGKEYKLLDDNPVLICRARGWHLWEKHAKVDGEIVPGAIWDFALYFHHNHKQLIANGTGPYFYLPKTEHYLEARLWATIMDETEDAYNVPRGTCRGTFLIETLPAVFQMNEILYEMRDHAVALNCGRWDYIFSYIKTLRNHPDRVLPDRGIVSMDKPFLNAYSRLLIQTCHKRGAMAMGGMAAFIPSKDPEANAKILEKVRQDKELEAVNGHDGTWIAHPGLAETAMGEMTKHIEAARASGKGNGRNLMHVMRADEIITAANLLEPCEGVKSEEGMRHNIKVAVQYIEAWIRGNGCVPIYGLMEDAATAEISRTSIWQWIRHGCELDTGKTVTKELFREFLDEEMEVVKSELGEDLFNSGRFDEAKEIMDEITTADECVAFLTLPAYERLA